MFLIAAAGFGLRKSVGIEYGIACRVAFHELIGIDVAEFAACYGTDFDGHMRVAGKVDTVHAVGQFRHLKELRVDAVTGPWHRCRDIALQPRLGLDHADAVAEFWQIETRLATKEEYVVESLLMFDDRLGNGVGIWSLEAFAVILCVDAVRAPIVTLRREMYVEGIVYAVATIDVPFHTPSSFLNNSLITRSMLLMEPTTRPSISE